jgi:hypothetical protein
MSAELVLDRIRSRGYCVWAASFSNNRMVVTALDTNLGRKFNVQVTDGDLNLAAVQLAELIDASETEMP